MSLITKLKKLPAGGPQVLAYLYYQKLKFGITNTKFDISFTVFRESFLNDQYRIKSFSGHLHGTGSLLFVDIGRNHGFVFFYFLEHMARMGTKIGRIHYIGIDPSPLKFAYYDRLMPGTQVDYRLIDKAVVFDGSKTVKLKYGERNIGNFNVSGSNYETRMKKVAAHSQFIEIEVDTLQVEEVLELVKGGQGIDNVIVKIDCKNCNEIIMERTLDILADHPGGWLVACERDGSSRGRLATHAEVLTETIVASNRTI